MRPICFLLSTLLLSASVGAQNAPQPESQNKKSQIVPLQLSIPVPPHAFRGNGKWHLSYEMYIANLSAASWTIHQISATSDSGANILTVNGQGLGNVISHFSGSHDKATAAEIAPGETVVAFLWIDLPLSATIPASLHHELAAVKQGSTSEFETEGPSVSVVNHLTAIESPLRGKAWMAANGPSNVSVHRRSILVVDGTPHIAQRYAIDWVQIGPDNKTYKGDARDNHAYYCFGAEAHAIADGVVVEEKDGIPENVPNEKPVVPINFETVAGNHINLDLGGGVYAMYAHFQPGSLRVKVGDHVKAGQVLGLVGNTGNSSEPHLHFQLMDHNSPLGSEGLPYTMSYELIGTLGGSDQAPAIDRLSAPESHHDDMPVENQVVDSQP